MYETLVNEKLSLAEHHDLFMISDLIHNTPPREIIIAFTQIYEVIARFL